MKQMLSGRVIQRVMVPTGRGWDRLTVGAVWLGVAFRSAWLIPAFGGRSRVFLNRVTGIGHWNAMGRHLIAIMARSSLRDDQSLSQPAKAPVAGKAAASRTLFGSISRRLTGSIRLANALRSEVEVVPIEVGGVRV